MEFKNPEIYPVHEDIKVTVTIEMNLHKNCSDNEVLSNAASALTFFRNTGRLRSNTWVRRISIRSDS